MSIFKTICMVALLFITGQLFPQDTISPKDSINNQTDDLTAIRNEIVANERKRILDSVRRSDLQQQWLSMLIEDQALDSQLIKSIDSLKTLTTGYPVVDKQRDTLFMIYNTLGRLSPEQRASDYNNNLQSLFETDFITADSIIINETNDYLDIMYKGFFILRISESDAMWNYTNKYDLAEITLTKLRDGSGILPSGSNILTILLRIGLVIVVIAGILLLIWLIDRGQQKGQQFISERKDKFLKNLSYKDYTFLTIDQELSIILFLMRLLKWFLIVLLLYMGLPIVFSIFPFTQGWANALFKLVWTPFRKVFISIWDYMPNVFSIIVIYIVFRYAIRFVKYIFTEISSGKLKLPGFYEDWAQPTFIIVRFLLYAFMFILIFPLLPGSDSQIFKGVTVFIGVLISLGSTSAIANIIAGLVITYMRPFKEGDRIKIGEMTGDVIEKTLLVTRLRTIKNEEITIPNSSILSGNTINYTSLSKTEGLIVHTTVTIGYSVPWKSIHQALIDAALRTGSVLKDPVPFVLQTSLDDFYISYQINAYIREADRQAAVYSELHQHIQDVCNERGIEIMSPHYKSVRDGNKTTIPDEDMKKNE